MHAIAISTISTLERYIGEVAGERKRTKREEERKRGGGGNGVKTARWVILPTCSYSYQHMALLITSNYNTCKQCILRYANLVSPLLVLMHSAEVEKLGYIVWARIECCVLYRLWPKVLRFARVSQYRKNSEWTTAAVGFGTFRTAVRYFRQNLPKRWQRISAVGINLSRMNPRSEQYQLQLYIF